MARQQLFRVLTQQRLVRFPTFTQITMQLPADMRGRRVHSMASMHIWTSMLVQITTPPAFSATSMEPAFRALYLRWHSRPAHHLWTARTSLTGEDGMLPRQRFIRRHLPLAWEDCTASQLVDLTGDGLTDWVYTDGTSTYAYLNNGNGWQSATDTRWTLPFSLVYKSGGNCYDRGYGS
jgi:hypothetical protein